MPGAIMTINQPTGAGNGSPGVARNDLWNAQQIDLVVATGGNSSILWSLLDRPAGSAATIGSPTATTATLTPDVLGTYRVQLVTNGGGPGNISIKVLRVRKNNAGVLQNRGWCLPALGESGGESNFVGNLREWSESLEFIFADLLTISNQGIFPERRIVPGFTGIASSQTTGADGDGIGWIVFDPSAYGSGGSGVTRNIVFSTVLQVAGAMTAEVRLYNLDTSAYVTGTTLTSTSTTPARVRSAALTVGSSPNVPNSIQTYEVRLRISAGSPGVTDFAFCKGAHIEVSYV